MIVGVLVALKMNKKIILILTLILLITPMVYASDLVFERHKPLNITISCFDANNKGCDGSEKCQLTCLYPNGTISLNSVAMSLDGLLYSYSLGGDNTGITGEYRCVANCSDALTAGYTSFSFFITQQGNIPDNPKAIILFGLLISVMIILILCVVGVFKVENKYIKLFLTGMSYILLIWVSHIISSISSAYLDSEFIFIFSNAMFKILVSLTAPILLLLLGITIWQILLDKRLRALAKRGLPPR